MPEFIELSGLGSVIWLKPSHVFTARVEVNAVHLGWPLAGSAARRGDRAQLPG